MFANIDDSIAKEIDELTRRHCARNGAAGELKQLSTLFGRRYLDQLHEILSQAFPSQPRMSQELTIRLAWIDKIPLAKVQGVHSKTELGDAVLFAIERFVSPEGAPMGKPRARALLLQAKVADTSDRIAQPLVPVQPMKDSTKREFDLLSGWPAFDLYKASGSKTSIVDGIDLRGSAKGTLAFGWYVVAPRLKGGTTTDSSKSWTSWWMGAPAQLNRRCDISFGTLLRHFLTGRDLPAAGGLEVGARFECDAYPPTPADADGWNRVCAEIIRITEEADVPTSVFGPRPSRRLVATRSLPLAFALAETASERRFGTIDRTSDARGALPRRLIRRLLERIVGRRRMPILVFDSRIVEGYRSRDLP